MGEDASGPEFLQLKWGTLKGWRLTTEKSLALMKRYEDLGMSMGAAQQEDTPEHKAIICELIDAIDGEIENDWTGKPMTKDEAKEYVMNFGRNR
jgi:hypothetical protein